MTEATKNKPEQPMIVLDNYRGGGFYVFFGASRDPRDAVGPYQEMRTAVFVACGKDGVIPRFASSGFPDGVSNSFAEHAAGCTSQYDGTCRALAAELVIARMKIEALQMKLETMSELQAAGWHRLSTRATIRSSYEYRSAFGGPPHSRLEVPPDGNPRIVVRNTENTMDVLCIELLAPEGVRA